MRLPSNDLHELIKSLSGTEKSYFKKKTVGSLQEKIYLKLFDAIEKYGSDDKKIQKLLKIKNLSRTKNYLYGNILRTLRTYYSDLSQKAELTDMLRDAEVLFKKALFEQCLKLLEKVKKIAEARDMHLILIQVYETEMNLMRSYQVKDPGNLIRIAEVRRKQELDNYIYLTEYHMLNNRIFSFINEQGQDVRSKEAYDDVVSIARSPLLKDEALASTYQAKNFYYNTNALISFLLSDYEKACYYCKKRVEYMESEPLRDNSPKNYMRELSNLVMVEALCGRYSDAFNIIRKMQNIKLSSRDLEVLQFQLISINQLNLMFRTGEFGNKDAVLPEIESGLKKYKGKINSYYEINIYDNLSKVYFLTGDYRKSLAWINPLIMGEREEGLRPDYQCLIRIFYLLVHYELQNFELLYNLTQSTQRFIEKMNRLYKFEKTFLSFMKKISQAEPGLPHIQLFMELKDKLLPLKEDPYEKVAFNNFDYISWVESKISKTPCLEIIRQKYVEKHVG